MVANQQSLSPLAPHPAMASSSTFAKAKSFGKRVVGQPEEPVPVVTVKDWLRSVSQNPARDVSRYCFYVIAYCLTLVAPI